MAMKILTPTRKSIFAVDAWHGTSPVIIAGNFNVASAFEAADKEFRDKPVVIAFGRRFLSTPDLVFRLRHGIELNSYDRSTFYTPKAETGYIDQPFSKEFERLNKSSKPA